MSALHKLTEQYYIKDSNGNYYRLNIARQLVVAANKEDAGVFTWLETQTHIGDKKKAKFYSIVSVDEDEEVFVHNQSKETGSSTSGNIIAAFPECVDIGGTDSEITDETQDVEAHSDQQIIQIIRKEYDYEISQIDWAEYLRHFAFLIDALPSYKSELQSRQFTLEQEMQDLLHYIELCDIDSEEQSKILDYIRESRQNRRDVKDEILRIEIFQEVIGTGSNKHATRDGLKRMEKLGHRVYAPRQLTGLFQGAKYYENRSLPYWNECITDTQDADVQESQNELMSENECAEECYEDTLRNGQEENIMPRERIDTVFDGQANDWLSFAKNQLNFYQNVRQHMVNLEIDIDTIATMIEEVLVRIEDANFNVTQGYKVFKELKDLRNEKKDKEAELAALKALTECFDCQSMSEALEYSVQEMKKVYCSGKSAKTTVEADAVNDEAVPVETMVG